MVTIVRTLSLLISLSTRTTVAIIETLDKDTIKRPEVGKDVSTFGFKDFNDDNSLKKMLKVKIVSVIESFL